MMEYRHKTVTAREDGEAPAGAKPQPEGGPKKRYIQGGLVAVSLALAGCGEAPSSDATDQDLESQSSAFRFNGGPVWDGIVSATSCPERPSMHCCPQGWAMTGARLDLNVYQCRQP